MKKAGHDVLALVRSEAKGEPLKKAGVKIAVGELGNPAGYAVAAWGRAAFVHTAQDWTEKEIEKNRKMIANHAKRKRNSLLFPITSLEKP